MVNSNEYLRKQLADQILGGNAFKKIEEILEEVAFSQLGVQFDSLPYTFWQQFEHMRITQRDILDFSTHADYTAPEWPRDYWTRDPAPKDRQAWESSKGDFLRDRESFLSLIRHQSDLFQPFPHGTGQTLYREALLILEHNAYHTGQLAIISRLITK